MIRVAVAAVAVVGQHDVDRLLPQDVGEPGGGLGGRDAGEAHLTGRVGRHVAPQPAVGIPELDDPGDPEQRGTLREFLAAHLRERTGIPA